MKPFGSSESKLLLGQTQTLLDGVVGSHILTGWRSLGAAYFDRCPRKKHCLWNEWSAGKMSLLKQFHSLSYKEPWDPAEKVIKTIFLCFSTVAGAEPVAGRLSSCALCVDCPAVHYV